MSVFKAGTTVHQNHDDVYYKDDKIEHNNIEASMTLLISITQANKIKWKNLFLCSYGHYANNVESQVCYGANVEHM